MITTRAPDGANENILNCLHLRCFAPRSVWKRQLEQGMMARLVRYLGFNKYNHKKYKYAKIQTQKHNNTKMQTGITNYGFSQKFAPKQTLAIVILMEMMVTFMLTMVDNGQRLDYHCE